MSSADTIDLLYTGLTTVLALMSVGLLGPILFICYRQKG